jgi:hypothetical protein
MDSKKHRARLFSELVGTIALICIVLTVIAEAFFR